MYKKNTSIVGFGIGHFINAATGVAVVVGIPTCKRTLDGVGGACANAATYNAAGAIWEIDLAATDMNGDHVILSFTLTDCLPISYVISTSTVTMAELDVHLVDIITLLTAMPATAFPAPVISLDTIKTVLQFSDTTHDTLLTILIPIIEDIVIKYCGVSAITDLSTGVIFPIAGLCRYAMENPIGAVSSTVGGNQTAYGTFPNALLKLLDNFKPDTTGGYANAEVLNLMDTNDSLGL